MSEAAFATAKASGAVRIGSHANAAREAIAAGKRTIGTRVGSLREIVTDGENSVLVAPDDVRELFAALTASAHDDATRARLAAGGRITTKRFAWTRVIHCL